MTLGVATIILCISCVPHAWSGEQDGAENPLIMDRCFGMWMPNEFLGVPMHRALLKEDHHCYDYMTPREKVSGGMSTAITMRVVLDPHDNSMYKKYVDLEPIDAVKAHMQLMIDVPKQWIEKNSGSEKEEEKRAFYHVVFVAEPKLSQNVDQCAVGSYEIIVKWPMNKCCQRRDTMVFCQYNEKMYLLTIRQVRIIPEFRPDDPESMLGGQEWTDQMNQTDAAFIQQAESLLDKVMNK